DELIRFCEADDHLLLMACLEDRYGSYGKIGLALIECRDVRWTIKLLLMSCRVMSRGVGTVLISYIAGRAKEAGANLWAEFIPNGRNRMMYITYRLAGFREVDRAGDIRVLENSLEHIQPLPSYLKVHIIEDQDLEMAP